MKKRFIPVLLFFLIMTSCKSKAFEAIDNVKIVQEYYDYFYKETISAVIYDGNPDEINEFVEKVQHAKNISAYKCIKEALIEGTFYVEFYNNDTSILQYRIVNSQNAYDEINKKCKKLIVIDLIPNIIKNEVENMSSDNDMFTRHNFYKNCSEMTIKSIFRDITETRSFIFKEDTFPSTKIEPDYHKYLNKNYYGKPIRVLAGKKKNKNIILWLITENNTWKCFSSLEFSDNAHS